MAAGIKIFSRITLSSSFRMRALVVIVVMWWFDLREVAGLVLFSFLLLRVL